MTDAYPDEPFTEERVPTPGRWGPLFRHRERTRAGVSKDGRAFFSPKTVERIQAIIWGQGTPVRVLEASVFQFAA